MHLHLVLLNENNSEDEVFTVDLTPNQAVQGRFHYLDGKSKITAVGCLQWMNIFQSEDIQFPEVQSNVFKSIFPTRFLIGSRSRRKHHFENHKKKTSIVQTNNPKSSTKYFQRF